VDGYLPFAHFFPSFFIRMLYLLHSLVKYIYMPIYPRVLVYQDWHVTVGSKCENMWLKYAYCVQEPTSDTTGRSTPTSSGPTSPTQSDITSNCKQYYTVASGNSCTKIETQFSVTFDQLYQWNSTIDSNCGNLWVEYAVCVAVET